MSITKKEMQQYRRNVKKAGEDFILTPTDLHNLTDLYYMIDGDTLETLKINKMDEWFKKFFRRIEKITIPELYEKESSGKVD